jgi:hypothetical protein
MCSSLPGHRLRPWTSPTPIAVTTQPGPGPRPERVWPGAWAAQVSFVHPCTARLCPGHPLPPRSPLPARPAQYRQPPHTITLLPTKSDQPLCSGACCKRPPTAGNDLPQNPPVPKTPPDLQAIPTPNLVATMVATPIATAIATTVPGQPEAIPRTKPTAAQAPCTPPPPGHTPHGQPFSFSQPVILKTNQDMQWICRTPERVERCDEEVEARPRAALGQMAVPVRGLRRAGEGGRRRHG